MRVADYIVRELVQNGIEQVFTVVGGGAMHLNDAMGHSGDLHVLYSHHEQASAMAAEAYARACGRTAVVCVTTGPGATNAVTGVVGAWMASIPMLVISGQARYATTVYASGLPLRTRGVQEFDIVESVRCMTKYAELVSDPGKIRYALERAIWTAREGRPGPCWLDTPLDVQAAEIEPIELRGFEPVAQKNRGIPEDIVDTIVDRVRLSERPVLHVGNGVRLSGAHDDFLELVDLLGIPAVTSTDSVDLVPTGHPLYAGRCGTTGDRAGNFAVQNSDLLFSIGGRLGFFQTGFNAKAWGRGAYKIINDVDAAELEKDSVNPDMKVCCNAGDLIDALIKRLEGGRLSRKDAWVGQCKAWRDRYPVVLARHRLDPKPNIYAFFDVLTRQMVAEDTLLVSCGTSRVVGTQAAHIVPGMRFITNPCTASMGFDLPAAIGAYCADPSRRYVLVTGEGSLQMNIQELQTIVQNKVPVKVFVINNGGYHSIRMTQTAFFEPPLVGVGPESGDLSFPDLSKLIPAYGIPFMRVGASEEVEFAIEWAFHQNGPSVCELMCSWEQATEPKVASRRLEGGEMVSAPLEDMAPFLSREELAENMYIPLTDDSMRG